MSQSVDVNNHQAIDNQYIDFFFFFVCFKISHPVRTLHSFSSDTFGRSLTKRIQTFGLEKTWSADTDKIVECGAQQQIRKKKREMIVVVQLKCLNNLVFQYVQEVS